MISLRTTAEVEKLAKSPACEYVVGATKVD
jgi:hypothetical protein